MRVKKKCERKVWGKLHGCAKESCVAAGTCQVVSLWVLMNKPAAASQTPEDPGADGAELLGQACQSR